MFEGLTSSTHVIEPDALAHEKAAMRGVISKQLQEMQGYHDQLARNYRYSLSINEQLKTQLAQALRERDHARRELQRLQRRPRSP